MNLLFFVAVCLPIKYLCVFYSLICINILACLFTQRRGQVCREKRREKLWTRLKECELWVQWKENFGFTHFNIYIYGCIRFCALTEWVWLRFIYNTHAQINRIHLRSHIYIILRPIYLCIYAQSWSIKNFCFQHSYGSQLRFAAARLLKQCKHKYYNLHTHTYTNIGRLTYRSSRWA